MEIGGYHHDSWNPFIGCERISPACDNCYAITMAERLQRWGTDGYEDGFQFSIQEQRYSKPLKRQKPAIYFVNSMSDIVFPDLLSDILVTAAFNVMFEGRIDVFINKFSNLEV